MANPSSNSTVGQDDMPNLPLPGDVVDGKYRVGRVVGSGGMGIVVSAEHLQLGQTVAIKFLLVDGLDEPRRVEACTRFLREGQAAARLKSEHVVRIYDVGTTDLGAPFMVMELLHGEDLASVIERQGPAPVDEAAEYIVQACDAVGEAHKRGIVHRDLKPSNLFLSPRNDGRVLVKVLDFGISKFVAPDSDAFQGNLTETRSVVGSPYYMSPEQVRDAKRVDARTDVWSLGMILYELLAGEPAFFADTLPAVCAAIAADEPPPLRARRADVSEELETVVMRCLAKDPSVRFQSVAELVMALAPFAPRSQPVSRERAPTSSWADLPPEGVPRPRAHVETVRLPAEESRPAAVSAPRLGALRPPGVTARTLVSPSSSTVPAPPLAPTPVVQTPRSAVSSKRILGVLALLLGAAAVIAYARKPSEERPPAPVLASAPKAASFTLTIESVPSGASVLDGDRVLGTTPLAFFVDSEEVARAPKRLVLLRDGYGPYSIVQGPSAQAVRVLATLTALEPAVAATPPAASTGARPAPRRPVVSAPKERRPASTGAPPPSDIRLER